MKKYILVTLIASVCLACKPEPMKEKIQSQPILKEDTSVMQPKDAMSSQEPNSKLKQHVAEVRLSVPDSTWSLNITQVVQTEAEIFVLAQLTKSDMMGIMVISEVVDAVTFEAKDLPVKYYIEGKTWGWENGENYIFLKNNERDFGNAEGISFEKTQVSKPGGVKSTPHEEVR